jgi:CysZ protein
MQNQPISGFAYATKGLRLIIQPGIRVFVIIPLVINIIVFSGLLSMGVYFFDDLMEQWLPTNSWLSHLSWLLWPLFTIALLLFVFYTFTAAANLLAAPFNGLLAEKVEASITGKPLNNGSAWKQIAKDFFPSIFSEIRKLLYFVIRAIPLALLFLIPGINLLAPFLWLGFTAWYIALEYIGYPMGNHKILFKQQHARLKPRRFKALGFGAGILLLMAIPGINFLAMPAGVAGATLMWRQDIAEPAHGE